MGVVVTLRNKTESENKHDSNISCTFFTHSSYFYDLRSSKSSMSLLNHHVHVYRVVFPRIIRRNSSAIGTNFCDL